MTSSSVVAIYLRISHDPHGSFAGVERQNVDCRHIAALRWPGFPIIEYIDNDVSAYTGKRRPAYSQLLADLSAGTVTAVVAYNLDRLLRQPRDLETLIDLGVPFVTAQGDLDLTSHDGQLHARILAAVAKKSSDDASRRIKRAALDRAERGEHHGGTPPYGLCRHGGQVKHDPAAVAVILQMCDAVLLDGSILRAMKTCNIVGHPSAPQTRSGWQSLLQNPALHGYNRAMHLAAWPAIVPADIAVRLREVTTPNSDRRPRQAWPLSAIARCGKCGGKMYGTFRNDRPNADRYTCHDCHGVTVSSVGLEQFVAGALAAVVDVTYTETVTAPDADASIVLEALAVDYATGQISRGEWQAARAALKDTARTVHKRHDSTLELPLTRAGEVIERIVIAPIGRGSKGFQPGRVEIIWRH